jgi:hypothetical protein
MSKALEAFRVVVSSMKKESGGMPPEPTLDVEKQESSAEPATLLGGGSMTALPKSCLKKAETVPSTQVRGITWNGVFVTMYCEASMLGDEIAFPERVIDVLVEGRGITLGRTMEFNEVAKEVEVTIGVPLVVEEDYMSEAFQRALKLKEKEESIIAEGHKMARRTLVESFMSENSVAYVKSVKETAEADLDSLRKKLLVGKNVHDEILFVQAFLGKLPKI